ncbi:MULTISPECIES: hypothetical protein [unclassified Mycobacterium]|uniref:hypothetical protein n=1 Tax=unclassified Mycobacterium TaxID=2642494 RepID=UPI000992F72D|nr:MULTISPECIES: hypothetical protein [unclassified Mycobacterium]
MGLFQTIAAAQSSISKRRNASDEILVEFVDDLIARFPARSADILKASQDIDRPNIAHIVALRVMLDLQPQEVPDHPGLEVLLPVQLPAEVVAWNAIMDLAEFRCRGWTLVGGQMVHLLAWEHDEESPRVTTDADVVLDVRAYQTALHDVTRKLVENGFSEDGVSPDGIGHRYRHLETVGATVDVLIPEGLNAENFTTVTGARTISAAGSVQALERSMRRRIRVGDRQGYVIRPDVHAALVGKAAGYQAECGKDAAERHLRDFAYLASLCARRYPLAELQDRLTNTDRRRIANVLGYLLPENPIWRTVQDGVAAREQIVSALRSTTSVETGS